VQPDTAIYNSIMRQQAAARMGPSALEQTLSDMETHGLQPDRRSLFVLLREYGRRGDLAGAMTVMRRMAQLGERPCTPGLPLLTYARSCYSVHPMHALHCELCSIRSCLDCARRIH